MADSTAPQLTPDVAYQHLLETVYVPTLMSKLAANGIVPATEAEFRDLLMLATHLRTVAPEKQASSRFSDATAALNEFASQSPVFSATQEQGLKTAAAKYASDPGVVASVLTLLASEQDTLAGNQ